LKRTTTQENIINNEKQINFSNRVLPSYATMTQKPQTSVRNILNNDNISP
jgi:hypothetical protein